MDGVHNRILMFGWELPPFNSGGLGAACDGLTRAMAQQGVGITFVLPRKIAVNPDHMQMAFAEGQRIKQIAVDVALYEYATMYSYQYWLQEHKHGNYASNLVEEVYRYGLAAREIAKRESHQIIHAHDWLSFRAGIEAKKVSGKPLITHIHATEFDRACSDNVHSTIYEIERSAMEFSDKVIAVSQYTKNLIVNKYGIAADKISVVHNGIHAQGSLSPELKRSMHKIFGKIVLFVGRLTLQKGADYFLHAAQKVLQHYHDVTFVISGSGDMQGQIVNLAAHLGISHRVFFPGFLRGQELTNLYKAADLFVLPSVSEPFGIVALEAASHHTPVIISRQSGVAEVLTHSLKVDFWDTSEMAAKILSVLNYESLGACLSEHGRREVDHVSWHRAADKCVAIYQGLGF